MRVFALLFFAVVTLIAFQNCGQSAVDPGFFAGPGDGVYEGQSTSESRGGLFAKLKEANPRIVNILYNPGNPNHTFTVGGTCGTGGAEEHFFTWEIKDSATQQIVAMNPRVQGACIVGRFALSIQATLALGTRYTLRVEIVGVEDDIPVTSPLPTSISFVDVVAVDDPDQDPDESVVQQYCRRQQLALVLANQPQRDDAVCQPIPEDQLRPDS